MDNNDRQTAQGGKVDKGEVSGDPAREGAGWRNHLPADSRHRVVNKIMDILKRHQAFSGPEGLEEVRNIALRFEEKIYAVATSQPDYVRRISLKMMTMDTNLQNPTPNSLQCNAASNNRNPQDEAPQTILSQTQNQVQQIPIPIGPNQAQVHLQPSSLKTPNNMAPSSAGSTSATPPVGGMSQGTVPPSVPVQNANLHNIQNMNGVDQNTAGTSTSLGPAPQRPMQGRPQQIVTQERQQQPQNSQQYLYGQQLQQHPVKQNLQQGNAPQSTMQSQIQQQKQNLLQPNQLQSSQQGLMQSSLGQMATPSIVQSSQKSSLPQSTQSMLQQQSQSVRQQQQLQPRPLASIPQHPMISSHQQQQRPNAARMPQIQLIGKPSSVLDAQKQPQLQQRVISQTIHQQNTLQNVHQQQLGVPQNSHSNVHRQHVGAQSNVSSFQPLLMGGIQHGRATMLPNQQPVHTLQQQTTIDLQMQSLQNQRLVPDPSVNQPTQTGNFSEGDWQEEIYQKIKSMHDMYYSEVNEIYRRTAAKVQQHDAVPQLPKNEQLEKLRMYKNVLEQIVMFLQTSKTEILPIHREKIATCEKQIFSILNNNRPRKPQGQFSQPQMQAMQQSQQQQAQVPQVHDESQMNSQMDQMNAHGSSMATQQNNLMSLQKIPSSSSAAVAFKFGQSMVDASRPGSNAESGLGHSLNQIQQVGMSSVQQSPVSALQQMNINSISSQTGLNPLRANSNNLQQIKQDLQMLSSQQVKQQRQMQNHYLQQQQQQVTQQLSSQIHPQKMMQQLNQINNTNDVKTRHQMGGNPRVIQQHASSGQRSLYHQQPMKSGSPYSFSSQSVLQALSPQIGHHSAQVDQQYLLASPKSGTPLQSVNSPFIASSPLTSVAPSPAPVDSDKITHGMSLLSNAENVKNQSPVTATVPSQSLAIGTPGISASPLLAEFASTDGARGAASAVHSGSSSALEHPLQRLMKAVKSMSPSNLTESVSDVSTVVTMVDGIAGSAPGNRSQAAPGEDLFAMIKCHLQDRNFFMEDGPGASKEMRRYTNAVPSNVASSTGSVTDDLRYLSGNESDGESSGATSSVKRSRVEANYVLEKEVEEINRRLIDTAVNISEGDVDPTSGGGGIIVKCSYSPVAVSDDLKSHYHSGQMSTIQPLRLLIPNNYPNSPPIVLDNSPISVEVSEKGEDLSLKTKSRFSESLRALDQPMSLSDIAKTWDKCARAVICEYAQKSGGGTFSSKYGKWWKDWVVAS